MNQDELIKEVAKLAGITPDQATSIIDDNVPNKALLSYIIELKKNYKLGILSNASGNLLNELFKPEQIALFDAIALSYETGVVKPDHRSFEIVAERLGVEPEGCVFIDDQQRYCDAAREVGMPAIWYQDFQQMKAELEKLLADSKS
jgi:HAD superfamily hydrolase (TIGR01509 family)